MDLSKNEIIQLKIEKMVYGGEGLGRWNDIAIFVPDVAPGDVVKVQINQVKKNFARGQVVKILQKSSVRAQPKCPFFVQGCGGCQWMYIDYQEQLQIKKRIVEESVARAKLENVLIKPLLAMDKPYHFRNKATAQCLVYGDNSFKLGFFTKNSHEIVDIFTSPTGNCLAQNEQNNRVLKEAAEVLSKYPAFARNIKDVAIRSSEVQTSVELSHFVVSQMSSQNKIKNHVYFQIRDKKFRVFGPSFFQTNSHQAKVLVDTVESFLMGSDTKVLVDLFSGVGLFAISFAQKFDQVYGIESSISSIKDAEFNLNLNKITNIKWIGGKAEQEFTKLRDEGISTIILDPPREGCQKKLLQEISPTSANKIIYVSCDLATLCRDLKILQDLGYCIPEIQPIDMFPHTYHVECVAKIER